MFNNFRAHWKGIFLAAVIGITAVLISTLANWPILDPLVVALLIGIILKSFIPLNSKMIISLKLAPTFFIPIGVIFYGATSLNFIKTFAVDTNYIFMLFIVFMVYILSGYLLSHLFGLNEKTGYLIATGSAICGASAIAITSDAIDAEAEDVSNSLISVFISALIGLFIILPFLSKHFNLTGLEYGFFSGTVLQFTGFVKASVGTYAKDVQSLAMSVKAVRYMGLIFLVPLFGSFVKGKVYIPWYLWAFVGAGVLFTFMPDLAKWLVPSFKIILNVLWSIAMAAIGLNANMRTIFTKVGLRALAASLIAFLLACGIFVLGIKFM